MVVCKVGQTEFEQRIADFSAALQNRNRRLYAECMRSGYRHLQAAIDHVESPGMTIYVLPGLYQEEPSLAPESDVCQHLDAPRVKAGYQVLTYEQQRGCPHQQNLVGIFGLRDLQIEGTGASPSDVVFDAQFQKLNAIRGDRANGLYLRNFTAERTTFNAVYVLETDGFVIDRVVGRWNDEYGFLAFASDHGLITNCEAYGNGDSGVYPGGTSDINRDRGFDVPRYAIEVSRCHSHDNLLGYSGTGGDSVWVHDNEFDHNTGGVSMDSLFPNHPGLPQNHALFEHNSIHGNNSNYYRYVRDGTCKRPYLERGYERGVVCPVVQVPVGTGVLVIGGNYNVFRDNHVYDNWKIGFVQTWVPGIARDDFRWAAQSETSHFNHYMHNQMGRGPSGESLPNGLDFFWDGEGEGSCWQGSASSSQPLSLPACPDGNVRRVVSDPNLLLLFVDCSAYDRPTQTLPAGCDWFSTPPRPSTFGGLMNIQSVAPAVQLAAVFLLAGWLVRRRDRRDALDFLAAGAALAGSLVLLLASVPKFWYLTPIGIAILGLGWIGLAQLAPSRRLAFLSVLLGVVAILEAVDDGIVLLPLPVGLVWIRIVLELVWIIWTARLALARPRRPVVR